MEQENHQIDENIQKDSVAIQDIINKVKSQGLFDQFRKECLADVDTKPAYHNLIQRVEKFVERFLNGQKWNSNVNKNQLRETLRRQLNNSGIMSIGVDRIIEQVVNPKILLGIKPRIDDAVCEHLGIDLKARQEEQQRRKEKQRVMLQQQQLQQQHLQNGNFGTGPGILPTPGDMPWSSASSNFLGGSVPGMPYNMGFGGMMQPFSFMGHWGPGLPGTEGFNQNINSMIPGQPMIPAFPPGAPEVKSNFNASPRPAQSTPDFSKPPPSLPGTPMLSSSSSIVSSPGVPGLSVQSSPTGPPGIHPSPVGAIIRPPPPSTVPPPPGTVPVLPPVALIPPTTPMAPPASPLNRPNIPTTPNIPALISHTLSKVSKEELTPEKIAVFKTAAAFITKTVSNAQSTPGADLATMFSPRVLAEAMMAESGAPLTKHELRAAKRKERIKEFERLKAEREKEEETKKKEEVQAQEDPLPPKHNLMDVFQGAEDVSDDEESFNMLLDGADTEDSNTQGVLLSDDSEKEEQPPTSQPGKRYNFAWDVDKDDLSDVTVSSIHTSDISSFEDISSSHSDNEEDQDVSQEQKEDKDNSTSEKSVAEDKNAAELKNEAEILKAEIDHSDLNDNNEITDDKSREKNLNIHSEVKPSKLCGQEGSIEVVKRRKLIALSYKYSDSDEEETREERKARIAKEKEERYLKRQQRRAEMEAKKKEREDEKARVKEEKQKLKEEKIQEVQKQLLSEEEEDRSMDISFSNPVQTDQDSPNKSSPRKRRNKAEIKEQLHQQKVQERKAALRRQRTRNRRYASDEFTSIFTERKTLNQSYSNPPDDIVTFDGNLEVVEMTVDQECVVETVNETVEVQDGDRADELTLQCPSPYSDISDKSMSDRSEDEQPVPVEMEEVSSDEDLDTGDNIAEDDTSKGVKFTLSSGDGDESEASQESAAWNSRFNSVVASDTSNKGLEQQESVDISDNQSNKSQDTDDGTMLHAYLTNIPSSLSIQSELESQKVSPDNVSEDDKLQKSNSVISLSSSVVEEDKINMEGPNTETDVADSVKEPMNIMADLELEPVSDEETPLSVHSGDDSNREDGEEEELNEPEVTIPAPELSHNKTASSQKDEEDASDEGEIKSDSDKNNEESQDERLSRRKPIELVDFGEAEKRSRSSRGYFPDVADRRSSIRGSATHTSFRGGYTWTQAETASYVPPVQRYPVSQEALLSSHSKSPLGYDGAESEASSHSRSSVRLRDDVPPPYPIEGVNTSRRKRSPGSEAGSSLLYKPVSPPSPVSSSSRSSSSSSVSRSRSKSVSSSRSSSLSSISRRKKRKHKKKKRRRRSSRNREAAATLWSFSSSKSLENNFSPVKLGEQVPKVTLEPQVRERLLSSGHESISSDELPYFPDEPQPPPSPPKIKAKRRRSAHGNSSSESSTSGSPLSKKKRSVSPSKESISSSELIYSPRRLKSPKKSPNVVKHHDDINDDDDDNDDNVSIERPPMSPGRSSISSGELPDYPEHNLEGFSPHCPPLPPEDIDGFQPPLPPSPDNFVDNPPLPPPSPEEEDVTELKRLKESLERKIAEEESNGSFDSDQQRLSHSPVNSSCSEENALYEYPLNQEDIEHSSVSPNSVHKHISVVKDSNIPYSTAVSVSPCKTPGNTSPASMDTCETDIKSDHVDIEQLASFIHPSLPAAKVSPGGDDSESQHSLVYEVTRTQHQQAVDSAVTIEDVQSPPSLLQVEPSKLLDPRLGTDSL